MRLINFRLKAKILILPVFKIYNLHSFFGKVRQLYADFITKHGILLSFSIHNSEEPCNLNFVPVLPHDFLHVVLDPLGPAVEGYFLALALVVDCRRVRLANGLV